MKDNLSKIYGMNTNDCLQSAISSKGDGDENVKEEWKEPIYVMTSPRVPKPIAATLNSSDFVSPWVDTSEPSVSLDMSDYDFGGKINDNNETSSDKLPSVQIDTRPNSEAFITSSEDNTYTYTTATYIGNTSILDPNNIFNKFPLWPRGNKPSHVQSNSGSTDEENIILSTVIDKKAKEFTMMLPHNEAPKESICCLII